jgi:hypothetical protein
MRLHELFRQFFNEMSMYDGKSIRNSSNFSQIIDNKFVVLIGRNGMGIGK